MQKTNIPYVDFTWNPGCGCPEKVSPACGNCWADGLHTKRHEAYKAGKKLPEQYAKPFTALQQFPDRLDEPIRRKKPCSIAVMFMGDLFTFPFDFIDKVVEVAEVTPWHTYQLLTKRPERMLKYFKWRWNNADQHMLDCTKAKAWKKEHNIDGNNMYVPNLWLGVTSENQEQADKRIPILLQIPAAVRFVSIEPMLGPVDLNQNYANGKWWGDKLSWVIVGGESGPGARPMHPDWARSVRDQCQAASVPFFFKQWGQHLPASQYESMNEDEWRKVDGNGTLPAMCGLGSLRVWSIGKKKAGCLLDGREYKEYPLTNNKDKL